MAGYKGHIAGAVGICAVYTTILSTFVATTSFAVHVARLNDWQYVASLFVISILFGLWPDVDTNSKGQDIFFGLAFIVDLLLIFTKHLEAAAYLGLLAMTPIVGKHRGWTHSKIAMLAVPLPLVLVPYLYQPEQWQGALLLYGAAVAGYFSHLLFDGKIIKSFRVKGNRFS